MTKKILYETPSSVQTPVTICTVLCQSETGSSIKDLVEDNDTLDGLFD